jgi:hypothetical protein
MDSGIYQTSVTPALLLIEAATPIKTKAQKPGLYLLVCHYRAKLAGITTF